MTPVSEETGQGHEPKWKVVNLDPLDPELSAEAQCLVSIVRATKWVGVAVVSAHKIVHRTAVGEIPAAWHILEYPLDQEARERPQIRSEKHILVVKRQHRNRSRLQDAVDL